jgi:hypothetical protein
MVFFTNHDFWIRIWVRIAGSIPDLDIGEPSRCGSMCLELWLALTYFFASGSCKFHYSGSRFCFRPDPTFDCYFLNSYNIVNCGLFLNLILNNTQSIRGLLFVGKVNAAGSPESLRAPVPD